MNTCHSYSRIRIDKKIMWVNLLCRTLINEEKEKISELTDEETQALTNDIKQYFEIWNSKEMIYYRLFSVYTKNVKRSANEKNY